MKRLATLLIVVAILTSFVAACAAPTPQVIEKEVVVEKEVPVTVEVVKEKVVEKKVVETVVVEVTPVPEPVVFVYLTGSLAETLDDHLRGDNPSGRAAGFLYEPLIDFKLGTMELAPNLATDWSVSDDGLTYTFHLRNGVKFHDGTTFDADDVKATYERLIGMGVGLAYFLDGVKEVRVVDPLTVEIVQEGPHAPFLGVLPAIQIYSAEAIAEHPQEWFADHAVGTGPYKLVSYRRGEEMVVTKFDDYWRGWEGKHVDTFVTRVVSEPATERMMLENREAHMGDIPLPFEDLEEMAADPNLQVFENASIRHFYLKLNTVGDILQDKRLRKVIDLAFDHQSFCHDFLMGHCEVPRGLLPAALPDHDPTIPEPQLDLEKAAQLLDEAGWIDSDGDGIRDKDGKPLRLTMQYLGHYEWQRMGSELLQSNLAKIGVQLVIEGQPWSTMVERMSDPTSRPDINFVAVYADSPSADTVFTPLFACNSGHWSNFEYCDPYVDEKIEEARKTIDDEARRQIYYELDRYLMDECPAVAVVTMTGTYVATSDVRGFVYQPMDPYVPAWYNLYLE